MLTLLGFGLSDNAGCGCVAFSDIRIAFLDALANMLFVQTTGELQQVVGAAGIVIYARHVLACGRSLRRRLGGCGCLWLCGCL